MLAYYQEHSVFTQPEKMKPYLQDLPNSIPDLIKVVQGLLIHRVDSQIFDINLPDERLPEIEIRKVSNMLSQIIALNPSSLTVERSLDQKLISTCRDFALFLCAFLRHKKIPARVRVGFVNYLWGGTQDHLITEYWDKETCSWRRADSRITPVYLEKVSRGIDLNILDVQDRYFEPVQNVWYKCRTTDADPNQYAYGLFRKIRGMRHIQDRLIADLACLNKVELLPWDLWGYMIWDLPGVAPHEQAHLELLDQLAAIDTQSDFEKIRSIYQHPQLKLSSPVLCASPLREQQRFTVEEVLNAS